MASYDHARIAREIRKVFLVKFAVAGWGAMSWEGMVEAVARPGAKKHGMASSSGL
jgi:hypothetical protein